VVRDIAANSGGALKRGRVAAHAIGRVQRVVIVDVAGSAGRRRRRHVRSGQRESSRAVIKYCRRPAHRGVASRAIRRCERSPGRGVHRIVGGLPRGQMALRVSAIGRRDRQSVIVVDVAGSAGHVGMAIGQQESGGAVIEDRRCPAHGVVARRALRHGKCRSSGRMHGIIRGLPGGQMAL